MYYLTQLIYIKPGQEEVFHQFEDVAIPIIGRYNGQLILRIRPDEKAMIAGNAERPYEIHIVAFNDKNDFLAFARDEERKQFLHLKEQSIRSSLLLAGEKIG